MKMAIQQEAEIEMKNDNFKIGRNLIEKWWFQKKPKSKCKLMIAEKLKSNWKMII